MKTIEELAREAGAEYGQIGGDESTEGGMLFLNEGCVDPAYPSLERFAALVRQQALEEQKAAQTRHYFIGGSDLPYLTSTPGLRDSYSATPTPGVVYETPTIIRAAGSKP